MDVLNIIDHLYSSILTFWNCYKPLKDCKNRIIKDKDVILIDIPVFCEPNTRLVVRKDSVGWVVYNPNCCRHCRDGFSYIDELKNLDLNKVTVIGNLNENASLIPLVDFEVKK